MKIVLFGQDRKKTYIILGCLAGLLVLCIAGVITAIVRSGKAETIYRETQAVKGNLTVGVTESGNVSIGTSEQTFDVDISEYTGTDTSFSWENAMGQDMSRMFQDSSTSTSSTGRTLEIEEVYVTAGQEITEGTPLLKLTADSVSSIRQELKEDAANAQITYAQLETNQQKVNLQAQADLDSNIAYGTYADADYEKTVNALSDSASDLQEQITEAQEELAEKNAEMEEMNTILAEQKTVLSNAEYARDNTSREDSLYWWIVAVNTVSDTEDLIETLETEIETAQEEIETLNAELTSLNTELSLANKEKLTGEIEAEAQRTLRQYNYQNAQEIYDVTVGQSDFETENAKKDYEDAQEKLDEFDDVIVEGVISSSYNGIITAVGVSAGNSLEQDGSIITLNDYEEAAITVTVDEEDMEAAAVGNEVNIFFTAFPEKTYKGRVTEIGDAEINSNTNTTTYSVTVSLAEEATGLYEGMSAEVTFITKESEEVLYVSNRAIIREGTVSYVKVKEENGSIDKKEVVTGFSDGINVEIIEGLSEGDTVLIESAVH